MHTHNNHVDDWSGIEEGSRVRLLIGKEGTAIQEGWFDAEPDRYPIPYWYVRLDNGQMVRIKTQFLTLIKEIKK